MLDLINGYQEPSTTDITGKITDKICWQAYENVRGAKEYESLKVRARSFREPSSDERNLAEEDEASLKQAKLWVELKDVFKSILDQQVCFSGAVLCNTLTRYMGHSQRQSNSNDFSKATGFLDTGFDCDEQVTIDAWKDTVSVAPKKIGSKKVRIIQQLQLRPVAGQDELQVEDDEWKDTAAVGPKKVGSCKIRVTKQRLLRPVISNENIEE